MQTKAMERDDCMFSYTGFTFSPRDSPLANNFFFGNYKPALLFILHPDMLMWKSLAALWISTIKTFFFDHFCWISQIVHERLLFRPYAADFFHLRGL